MSKHTKGPWRRGANGTCVIADCPAPGINGSDAVEYYGGHMICESINGPNGDLVIAAPELLEAVKQLSVAIGDLCAEFCITEADLREDNPEVLDACKFADNVLAKLK